MQAPRLGQAALARGHSQKLKPPLSRATWRERDAHPVSDVVHDNRSCGAAVVHGRETMVALLAGRVPDLELDCRLIERNRLREERSADGRLLVLKELSPHKAQHERRLADCAVTEKHQLVLEHPALCRRRCHP